MSRYAKVEGSVSLEVMEPEPEPGADAAGDGQQPPPQWFLPPSPLPGGADTLLEFFMACVAKKWCSVLVYTWLILAPFLKIASFLAEFLSTNEECTHYKSAKVRLYFAIGTFAFCLPWPFLFHSLRKVVHLGADDKEVWIELILAKQQPASEELLRAELGALEIGALLERAEEAGASKEEMERAWEAAAPKGTALLRQLHSRPTESVPSSPETPRSSRSPDGSLRRHRTTNVKSTAELKLSELHVARSFHRGHAVRVSEIDGGQQKNSKDSWCCNMFVVSWANPGALAQLRQSEWGVEYGDEQASRVFDLFDKDQDDKIGAEELRKVLKNLNEDKKANKYPIEKCEKMIAEYDEDDDGK